MVLNESQLKYVESFDYLVGKAIDKEWARYESGLRGDYGYNATFALYGDVDIPNTVRRKVKWWKKPTVWIVCGQTNPLRELSALGILGSGRAFSLYDPRTSQAVSDDRKHSIYLTEANILRGIPHGSGKADVILSRPVDGIESQTYENGILQIYLQSLLGSLNKGGVLFAQLPDNEGYLVDQKIREMATFFESLKSLYSTQLIADGWSFNTSEKGRKHYPLVRVQRKT